MKKLLAEAVFVNSAAVGGEDAIVKDKKYPGLGSELLIKPEVL